jgi:uncharacterized protein (TIGR02588 family)
MAEKDESTDQDGSDGGSSAGEYAVGALGGLLVMGLVAFLLYQAIVRDSSPEVSVEVTRVEAAGAGYAVHIEVRNDGGTTAEGVMVSGQLTRQGRQVGQASTTVSYVPPDSMRTATLVFSEDPRDGRLTVGVQGYVVA